MVRSHLPLSLSSIQPPPLRLHPPTADPCWRRFIEQADPRGSRRRGRPFTASRSAANPYPDTGEGGRRGHYSRHPQRLPLRRCEESSFVSIGIVAGQGGWRGDEDAPRGRRRRRGCGPRRSGRVGEAGGDAAQGRGGGESGSACCDSGFVMQFCCLLVRCVCVFGWCAKLSEARVAVVGVFVLGRLVRRFPRLHTRVLARACSKCGFVLYAFSPSFPVLPLPVNPLHSVARCSTQS